MNLIARKERPPHRSPTARTTVADTGGYVADDHTPHRCLSSPPSGAQNRPCGPPSVPRNQGHRAPKGRRACSSVRVKRALADIRGGGMVADGQLIAGRYRVVRALADGGMGRVWLATDEIHDRPVAIKKYAVPEGL